MLGVRSPSQRDHGRMLEQDQDVVVQPAVDAIPGERALELESVAVGNEAPVEDVDLLHVSAPAVREAHFPLQTPPAIRRRARTTRPVNPAKWSNRGANRKPIITAPNAAMAAMAPRWKMFSTPLERRQPKKAATAIPAKSPARMSVEVPTTASSARDGMLACWTARTSTSATVSTPPPSPSPDPRAPRPMATGSLSGGGAAAVGGVLTCR